MTYLKKKISFTTTSKPILRNMFKDTKDLYSENYSTLMKKLKDINGKVSCVHGLEEIILSNLSIL